MSVAMGVRGRDTDAAFVVVVVLKVIFQLAVGLKKCIFLDRCVF